LLTPLYRKTKAAIDELDMTKLDLQATTASHQTLQAKYDTLHDNQLKFMEKAKAIKAENDTLKSFRINLQFEAQAKADREALRDSNIFNANLEITNVKLSSDIAAERKKNSVLESDLDYWRKRAEAAEARGAAAVVEEKDDAVKLLDV
jgi:hypothetical protein